MSSIYEIVNSFEIRGSEVRIDKENKKIRVSCCQSDNTYDYIVLKEDTEDYNSSIIEIIY